MELDNKLVLIDDTTGKITLPQSPTATADNDLATLKDVKDYQPGYQTAIESFLDFTTSEPASPTLGERHIATATGVSSETTQSVTKDYIYEWNNTDWTETVPEPGYKLYDNDTAEFYVYTGSAWTVDHKSLVQKQIYYFGDSGNDSNSGLTDNDPLLTPEGAAAKIVAQTPSANNRFTMKAIGSMNTTNDFVMPIYTTLDAPSNTHTGRITGALGATIKLKKLVASSSSAPLFADDAFDFYCDIDEIEAGASGACIELESGAYLKGRVGHLNASASGAKYYALTGSYLSLYANSGEDSAVSTSDASSKVRFIIEDNDGFGTYVYNKDQGIDIKADGDSLTMNDSLIVNSAGYISRGGGIYTKELRIVGSTPAVGVTTTYAIGGLTKARVAEFSVRVSASDGAVANPENLQVAGYQYSAWLTAGSETLSIKTAAGGAQVSSRPFECVIEFEEA